MQKALESALAELVLGAPLDSDPASVAAWLDRHGVTPEDQRAILRQGVDRLRVYRSLIRGTLEEAVEASIPRTLARLGPLFAEYFDRFLAERAPMTHYVRDTTMEFLDHCEPLWAEDNRVPTYLMELGRHEALHIEIASAPPRPAEAEPAALDLDSGLSFIEAARLVSYRHAVHELPEALSDRSEPERRDTRLLAYRGPDHYVRYLALSPIAASIVSWLMRGASLRESLLSAATEHAIELDDALLTGAAHLLSDLSERVVVLGPCRPTFNPSLDSR
jgi:hypothetical protein